MEDLNNHQMILLATLVSFVTSIATGIITVSLLQQAPQTVTQTVNRVVERTIERVVTGTTTPASTAKTITQEVTKEVTVYAKEDDLIVSAVEKNQSRIATIYAVAEATGTKPIAIGFVASRDGLIMTTGSDIAAAPTTQRFAVNIGNTSYTAKRVEVKNVSQSLVFLLVSDLPQDTALDAVAFGAKSDPKPGQTTVVLGGDDGTGIFKTTLTRLVYEAPNSTSSPQILSSIEVTPKIPDGYSGGLAVNLDGQAVGMTVWSADGGKYIILPASRILDAINALTAQQSKQGADGAGPKQISQAENSVI